MSNTLALVIFALSLHLVVLTLAQVVLKIAINALPKARTLSLVFALAFFVSLIYALGVGELNIQGLTLWVIVIGFFNAFGAFAQWQAFRVSLSDTALADPLSSVLGVIGGAVLLGEAILYKNPLFVLGSLLMFSAVFFLVNGDRRWLFYVMAMVLVYGGINVAMRYFAFFAQIPVGTFLTLWYAGSFLGSLPLLIAQRRETGSLISPHIWKAFAASAGILVSLAVYYWALMIPEISLGLISPIDSFGAPVLVILAGWIFFKEGTELTRRKKIGFVLGLLGLAFLAYSLATDMA